MHVEVKHPCIQHKLSLLRDVQTGHKKFRELATEITMFLGYEALKQVELAEVSVQTPLATALCQQIVNDIVVVPVLRAGVGMMEGILDLVPTARVGFVGLYRDEDSKLPVEYYQNLPAVRDDALYVVVDPMLATGGTAIATLDLLKSRGARRAVLISIISSPEGLAAVAGRHPDVPVYTASVDERLDERKYIVPGLGDAGDRLYGTL